MSGNREFIRAFEHNKVFVLAGDEDCPETECVGSLYHYNDETFAYYQMLESNSDECFLVKLNIKVKPTTMQLLEGEEFKRAVKIYQEHKLTPDLYPVEIMPYYFMNGHYK